MKKDIINQKYDFIEEVIEETLVNKNEKAEKTEHVDRYMTSKWLGLPIFLVIMALVFFLTFTVGDWLKGYFETGLDLLTGAVSAGLEAAGTSPMLNSLLVDGIISGVGGILTFLPTIFILFLALAFLEDSGYMARVAFVMDDIMSHLGSPEGRSCRCSLDLAALYRRSWRPVHLSIEKTGSRTILVTPFMSWQREASDLCIVFFYVFRGTCDARLLFHVCAWDCSRNPDGLYHLEDRRQ